MKRRGAGTALSTAFAAAYLLLAAVSSAAPERRPAVAGSFYPDSPARLRGAVEAFMASARPAGKEPVALIAPHAGYVYSGQIAADAWNQARGRDYDLIVILGTNHTTSGFAGVSIYPGGGYRTPLGTAPVDAATARALTAMDDDFTFAPEVHAREHSVEVHVPFAQVLFPDTPLLTAIVGRPDPDLCVRFGHALAEVLAGRRTLIVASSDLSHFPRRDDALAVDRSTLERLTDLDPHAFHRELARLERRGTPGLSTCACGEAPIMAAMAAATALGADEARIVSYANSGHTALGEPGRAVGYAAAAFVKRDSPGEYPFPAYPQTELPRSAVHRFTEDERRTLLSFARRTISQYLTTGTTPLARDIPPRLRVERGVFVTVNRRGRLRGCIGHMVQDTPVHQIVGAMAHAAAFQDRRFQPLQAHELADLEIEISVLTPYERVDGPRDIVVGRDGVLLRKDGRSAVYLPQVAPEQGWDRDTMLDHLARKAGLPAGSWRSGAELFIFQAEIFSEHD